MRVLAQLCNLSVQLDKTMNTIKPFSGLENAVSYLISEETAEVRDELKAKARFVWNLSAIPTVTIEQIADWVEVSVEFVEEIRQKMADEQKLINLI